MKTWTEGDRQYAVHVADVMGDRMHHEDGYTDADRAALDKLGSMKDTHAVILTGDEIERHEATILFQDIVRAEMAHWVPDASQRLLFRAGRALGIDQPEPRPGKQDCGPNAGDHALTSDWVAGLFVFRCCHCFHIFQS